VLHQHLLCDYLEAQRHQQSCCCFVVMSLTHCRRSPEIQDAVAVLARHACLKAQDKADSRAATIKSCSELVIALPQWEQEQFVGFVYKLSRSSKVRHAAQQSRLLVAAAYVLLIRVLMKDKQQLQVTKIRRHFSCVFCRSA